MRKTKQQTTKYLNSIFRARGRSLPSSRGLRHFQYTIQIFGISLLTFLFANNASAVDYQNSTNMQFTFNPTLTVSVSDNLTIDNLSPGTYSDSNIIDVNVATNTVAGYTLSATVGTNTTNTDLTHSTYNNSKFTNLSSNKSSLSDFADDTWGYSYSTDNGANWISGSIGYTNPGYNGLPLDTNTTSSERGKGGTMLIDTYAAASSSNVKFKIGAKASSNQAAGTYTNTINFYAVSKVPPVSISDAYAAAGKTKTASGYYKIQDMSSGICNAVELIEDDSATSIIDTRDGEIYTIAKLPDGNCWMLDNLRLDPTNPATASNMSASNTNAPATAITNYLNGSSTAPQPGWSTAAVINTPAGSWVNIYDAPQVNITWSSNDKDSVVSNHYGAGSGKRGTYYNFCAATAGTYCWAGGAGEDLPDTIVDAPYDICPAGWHMPTGGARKNDTEQVDTGEIGDYQTLCNVLNGSNCTNGMSITAANQNSLQYKLGLPLSGYPYSDTQNSYDSAGGWWSSTYHNGYGMYILRVTFGNVWPMDYDGRYYGFTMRCLADKNAITSISDLTYFQDFASLGGSELDNVKNSMADDTNYTLTDKRDGNEYTVKKINGQIWMTQNLRITGVVPANGSNFTGTEFNVSQYSLDANDGSYANHCDATNGYNYACTKDSGNTTTGVWYNYYAATAGTISGSSNSTKATQDICPAGWHLPSGPNTTEGTDLNKLIGNTIADWQPVTSGFNTFGAVSGGYYYDGSFRNIMIGRWWLADAWGTTRRYRLGYNSSNNQFIGYGFDGLADGFFLRCVKSE